MIVLLVFVLAVAAFVYLGGADKLVKPVSAPSAVLLSDYSALNQSDFLYYYDNENQYGIKYPVGYLVEESPDFGTTLRFTALSPVSVSAEVISVSLFDQPIEEADFKELEADNAVRTNINGAPAMIFPVTQQQNELNETILLRQAVFDCANSTGSRYTSVVAAAIPQVLEGDLRVADMMIDSFNCTMS